jgi:hypothetical protein
MKFFLIITALLWATIPVANAQWLETSSRSDASTSPGLIHRQVRLENSAAGERVTIELAIISTKVATLRVIDNPEGAASLAEAMAGTGLAAGVNGGFFDPAFAPIGLRILDGKLFRPLVRAKLLTGVLLSSPGTTQILRYGEYSPRRKAYSAVQCGPLLVDAGAPVKGLNRTRPARRTFAAVGGDRVVLGYCSGGSLAQLAEILATTPLAENFKVQRALNLDGGSSSAFWFKRSNDTVFSISEYKNVRDFVGIAVK